jgi:ABC-type uncharacterized transport system involved in gliding motility auxiliary subunit
MLKQALRSANFLATVTLLGVLFIMVNYVASRRYARWDLTRERLTALADLTRTTVRGLAEPLQVTVFYQPNHRLYPLVTDLLQEYARLSPRVRIEHVDPDQDIARARALVQEFQIDVTSPEALNLVIFKSGMRHKYLSDTDLAEYDYAAITQTGEPRVRAFKGEEAFTSAILSVTQTRQPLVWVTTGHGEKPLDAADPTGLAQLKQTLEQQNMRLEAATLLEHTAVADDVGLIVIAGPTRRFAEQEAALLEGFLDRGGRVLALLDPLTDTGLEPLLARWGIALAADIVVDPAGRLPFVSAANLLVTTYSQHPIVEKMKMLVTLFPLARSVRPAAAPPEGLTVTPLALTSPSGWGETTTAVETFEFQADADLKGPVPIAAAAERQPPAASPDAPAPPPGRLVVIGDSEFAMNAQLGNVGNRDLAIGSVYWLLAQEERIGISPKPVQAIKLNLTAAQLTAVFWASVLALPAVCALLGAGMWWVRRT